MEKSENYQVVLLGQPGERADRLMQLSSERLADLGVESTAIKFLNEKDATKRDPRLPTIAVFFGYDGAKDADHSFINELIQESNIVVPIVSNLEHVSKEIPVSLQHINAVAANLPDDNFDRVVSLLLEGFRLLRRERRLFISYKRSDSQSLANQLYDALDAHGFDVFIDTRSVPPSADFQAELWHRLSDSDVVVLIDTPGFRASRWTSEELARANATNIQILHLLWPGQTEDSASAFSYFHPLLVSDFTEETQLAASSRIHAEALEAVCRHAERLRARAIAARHRYLVDSFCDAVRDSGLTPNVQPERWISIDLPSGKELAVVPTIGVPTSERINQVFDSISGAGTAGIWLLYDSRGLLNSWLKHLEWLDNYLPTKSVRVANADSALGKVAK